MTEFNIIAKFDLPGKPAKLDTISCGNINRTYKVTFEDGTKYILQNVNVNVFKKPYELMQNVRGVCDHLKAKVQNPDCETMTFAKTLDGQDLYLDEEGRYWRMYRFIDGTSYQSAEKPGLFYNAAYAFGRFQKNLSDYPAATLFETIVNFHNTVSRYADFKAAVDGCKFPERLDEMKEEIAFLLEREPLAHTAVDPIRDGKMPLRVTHNDTKLNNVLMHPETDEGMCVIDLDTVMPGSVLYDFGDAIRYGANTAAEDEPDLSKISLDLDAFAEFTRGFLAGVDGALTELELSLLPEGAMLLTYEQAMRFGADYLNGDTYFKINYDKHNLVRTKAQIALLADMENKAAEMHRIVEECVR